MPAPQVGSEPPLTASELDELNRRFEAKDAAIAAARQANDSLQAQLDAVRAEIAAVRAARQPPQEDFDEASTRELFIDADLLEAGWSLTDARDREYPVTGMPVSAGSTNGQGFVDYVLWGADGLPLAVIEAKRTRRDAVAGQQQAKLYADCLEEMTGRRPVIFYSNGSTHWLWDDAAGYPPRETLEPRM